MDIVNINAQMFGVKLLWGSAQMLILIFPVDELCCDRRPGRKAQLLKHHLRFAFAGASDGGPTDALPAPLAWQSRVRSRCGASALNADG